MGVQVPQDKNHCLTMGGLPEEPDRKRALEEMREDEKVLSNAVTPRNKKNFDLPEKYQIKFPSPFLANRRTEDYTKKIKIRKLLLT